MWSDIILAVDALILIGLWIYFKFYVLPRIKMGMLTCLDFLIHVEVRISTFRRTRWACDSPDCCGVARCYIPPANARSSPWHRPGYETSWRSNTHLATAH